MLIDAASGTPDVVIVATGSEVSLALEARLRLEKAGIGTRVVSMPCREWFEEQPRSYHEQGPAALRARPRQRRGGSGDGVARPGR